MGQNYRNQDLRGRNFAGQDLTDADFSGADVSGANFRGATLTRANFSRAKLYSTNFKQANLQHTDFSHSQCGPRGWVQAVKGILGLIVSSMFMIISMIFSMSIFDIITDGNLNDQIFRIAVSGIIFVMVVCMFIKNINNQILTIISFTSTVIFAFVGAFVAAGFVAFIGACLAVFTSLSATILRDFFSGVMVTVSVVGFMAMSIYNGDPTFVLLHSWGVQIGILGSTSFNGAILSHANFGEANLRFADFRRAIFTGTNWANARRLELAQFDRDYLNTPALRQLAVTHDGRGQTYDGLNLSGLYLAGAQLQGASFVSANLNDVNLRGADLREAVLKQTQLDNADLREATLHGATIEDWGITVNTQLDGIRCTHVFMRAAGAGLHNRLRKPDNEAEVFAEGEFAEFIRPLTDTLDLYHSQGVDPRAMSAAIKHMSQTHAEAEPQIVAMERRGQHGFNVRVQVAPDADKSALSATYFDEYQRFKALAEGEKQILLARIEEKDSRITSLEKMITQALQPQRYYDDPDAGLPDAVRALVPHLNNHFSLDEIEGLCFDMGIDDQNLRGQTKIAKIRALVQHCHRRNTIPVLETHIRQLRPNLSGMSE